MGYDEALERAGFTSVIRVDLNAPGSRSVVLDALLEAKQARERVCVHCADGTSMTGVVMADWLVRCVVSVQCILCFLSVIRWSKQTFAVAAY